METNAKSEPRARSSRLPVMKKHATGQWRLRLSGRHYYLGTDQKAAKAEANKLLADWVSNDRQTPPKRDDERVAEGTTIDEIVIEYHRRELPKRSPSMQERIKRALQPLQDRFGMTVAQS